jgi:hypothetical protein
MLLGVIYGNHMHMMSPHVRDGFFHEEIPAICSTIASINIANAAEQWATPGKHRHGSHGHRKIQNGFCVKTGYCRAAHMLDVQHKVPNMLLQQVPLLLEKVVPVRMVSDNLYRSSL